MVIRIGHLSTFYHTAILLIARGNSDIRLGAKIDWKLMGTGPAIMSAFREGKLDMAYIGLPPAIIGMDQGINIICVAGGHMEGTVMAGKSSWLGFPEVKELSAVLDQFRGRRIGVPGKGSIHDVILRDCLEKYGFAQEIGIMNYPWADLVTEAIVKDDVSAAFGTPALAIAIRRYAGGKILYPASKIWLNNPSYGIVVSAEFAMKEPKIVERFLGIHEEATEFIRKKPREVARIIANYVAVVDEQFVFDTLTVSPKYCAQLSEEYIVSTMSFVPVLRKLGYITSNIGQDRIFSRAMIDKVHPGRDHYADGVNS